MNRLLAIVLDSEEKAGAAMRELRHLDRKGDIALKALASVSKDADGHVNAMHTADVPGIDGAGAGSAADRPVGGRGHVASLGEASASRGSLHDTHDFWVAGMGLHFVEETSKFLKPGQVAVLADVKEEWTIPLDMAMEAVGGTVMRRARVDVVQAEFDQDIAAIKKKILQLEAVYRHAQGEAQARLQDEIDAAASHPSTIAARATLKLARLGRETAVHVRAIEAQAIKAQAKATLRRETRLAVLRKRYEKRAAMLRRAA